MLRQPHKPMWILKWMGQAQCELKPVENSVSALAHCIFFPPPVIQSQNAIHHGRRCVTQANLIIALDNAITHGSFYLH